MTLVAMGWHWMTLVAMGWHWMTLMAMGWHWDDTDGHGVTLVAMG